jgi:hypothetical protein
VARLASDGRKGLHGRSVGRSVGRCGCRPCCEPRNESKPQRFSFSTASASTTAVPPFPAFRRRHGISTVGDHSVLNNAANSTGQRQSSAPPRYHDCGRLATWSDETRRRIRLAQWISRGMQRNARLMRIFVEPARTHAHTLV